MTTARLHGTAVSAVGREVSSGAASAGRSGVLPLPLHQPLRRQALPLLEAENKQPLREQDRASGLKWESSPEYDK